MNEVMFTWLVHTFPSKQHILIVMMWLMYVCPQGIPINLFKNISNRLTILFDLFFSIYTIHLYTGYPKSVVIFKNEIILQLKSQKCYNIKKMVDFTNSFKRF